MIVLSAQFSLHLASVLKGRTDNNQESFLIWSVPVLFWSLNWNVTEQVQFEISSGDFPNKDLGIKKNNKIKI